MAPLPTPLLLLIAAAAFVLGCTASSEKGRTGTAAAAPTVVTLSATDYAFETADTLSAGWTTFRLVNSGGQPHMGQLVRLDPGMTIEDYLGAYEKAFRTAGPRPEWARRLGGPGVAAPQQTTNATLYLEPGNYLWICLFNLPDGIPHVVGHRMAKLFVVQAAPARSSSPAEPKADVAIHLTEYGFSLSRPLEAGRQMIRVENTGSESHEVAVIKLPPGKTEQDIRDWFRNPEKPPPVSMESVMGGLTSLASGATAYFELDVTRGEYVLFCLVTAPDGRSHVEHGMIRQIGVG
ncbi:MAG TPA: hypothetical protein VFM14_00020 [Gemmatimonadales bacterium]|nr:hypothetical protein [Gemmatimonadales bacterium]